MSKLMRDHLQEAAYGLWMATDETPQVWLEFPTQAALFKFWTAVKAGFKPGEDIYWLAKVPDPIYAAVDFTRGYLPGPLPSFQVGGMIFHLRVRKEAANG